MRKLFSLIPLLLILSACQTDNEITPHANHGNHTSSTLGQPQEILGIKNNSDTDTVPTVQWADPELINPTETSEGLYCPATGLTITTTATGWVMPDIQASGKLENGEIPGKVLLELCGAKP